MKILIFGCGYVGKALALSFFSKKHFVGITTRDINKTVELLTFSNSIHLLISPLDILNFILDYDVIIFSVAAKTINHYEETYLKNAELIVRALKKSSSKKQVIYTSSTSVYGDHFGNWVNEESELKGTTSQAQFLIQTEKKLLELDSHNICIFRLGEIIGPGREIKDRIIRNQGLTFHGDGTSYTNFSPLNLILEGINIAVGTQLNGIYNLCSSLHITRKDLYSKICFENNLHPITWDPNIKTIHLGNKRVSSEKFQELILNANQ